METRVPQERCDNIVQQCALIGGKREPSKADWWGEGAHCSWRLSPCEASGSMSHIDLRTEE